MIRRFLIFLILSLFVLSACSANDSIQQTKDDEQASFVTVYRSPT